MTITGERPAVASARGRRRVRWVWVAVAGTAAVALVAGLLVRWCGPVGFPRDAFSGPAEPVLTGEVAPRERDGAFAVPYVSGAVYRIPLLLEFAARDVLVVRVEALPGHGAVWRPTGAVAADCCMLEQSVRMRPMFADPYDRMNRSRLFVGLEVELCCGETEAATGIVERYRVTYRHHGVQWSVVRWLPRRSRLSIGG